MSESLFPDLGGADRPADSTVIPCPKAAINWIELEYLYADGTGVAGAAYVVQRPNSGQAGGSVLAQGELDSKGRAHAILPVGIEEVEVYFHDDPDGEPYREADADSPIQEPEPGFFSRIWDGITDGAKWVGGVLAGDFKEEPSTGQIIANMIVTMIPGIDQLGDARDIVANLKKLLWDRRWNEAGMWLSLLLCLIGLIPELGSLAKGIIKVAMRNTAKLADLLAVFNFFKKGNGVHWLREFAERLPTEYASAAANKLKELLDRSASYLQQARNRWFTPRATIDRLLNNIEEVKQLVPHKLKEAAEYIADKIKQALNEVREFLPGSAKERLQLRQVKAAPHESIPVKGTPYPQRVREFSINHEQGNKLDMAQGLGGARYEIATGRQISNATEKGADLVDPITGPFQLKGPLVNKKTGQLLTINDKMVDGLAQSVLDDLRYNTYTKSIVVDTMGMSPAQRDRLKRAIDADLAARPVAQPKPIIILE
jgi:hypothetical protein